MDFKIAKDLKSEKNAYKINFNHFYFTKIKIKKKNKKSKF